MWSGNIWYFCEDDCYLRFDGCCLNWNYVVFDNNLIRKFIFLIMVLYEIFINMYLKNVYVKGFNFVYILGV